MKKYLFHFIKGIAMGIANIIPGVSGGTIALITGIYEELINSLKSFDNKALKYILSFKIKEFIDYTNLYFLIAVFGGSIGVLFIIAYPLEFLLEHYPKLVDALFFGLILASIFSVGQRIKKWNASSVIAVILGFLIAISVTNIIPHSNENDNLFYIFLCGIISISGMMLPGLSGSYILILLGNYKFIFATTLTGFLVSIRAIFDSNLCFDYLPLTILSVFCAGSLFGLLSFSHFLSWLLKKYKDQTLATLTGFIAGSLTIIWPWKEVGKSIQIGNSVKTTDYDLLLPKEINQENLIAVALIISGIIVVYLMESFSTKNK